MKEWYDGYRFGNVEVYCPWDVISYCDELLDDPDASQKEADVAYDELNAAVNALVRRETPGGDVSQPADTSAANTVGVAVAAVVVCAAVLGVLLWKKRSNKDEK